MRTAILGIIFVILAAAGYFFALLLSGNQGVDRTLPPSDCDLSLQICRQELPGGGQIRLAMEPRPIPLMKPIRVWVEIADSAYQPRRLDITGLNMEMGLNRTSLKPDGEGRWSGETILPICSQRRMHWRAALVLEDPTEVVEMEYQFFTERP